MEVYLSIRWKKQRYQYQHYSPPTILYTVIIIINLNESQLNVKDSHFLQLVYSYENLLKVYESCFSLKFNRLCNKRVDWIFLLFPADTLRKADVTWNKLIFFIKLVSDTIASFPYHSATLPELLQDSNAILCSRIRSALATCSTVLKITKQVINRSSQLEVFLRKSILKIFSKFCNIIEMLCNFIETTLRHRCSPVNLLHIHRTPFPKNTSGWLLLY